MPYGVDKKQGGDSPENVSWMERCVKSVMSKNSKLSKGSAIAICKTQLSKTKDKKSEILFDPDILQAHSMIKAQFISKKMRDGVSYTDASALFDIELAKNNFDISLI